MKNDSLFSFLYRKTKKKKRKKEKKEDTTLPEEKIFSMHYGNDLSNIQVLLGININ